MKHPFLIVLAAVTSIAAPAPELVARALIVTGEDKTVTWQVRMAFVKDGRTTYDDAIIVAKTMTDAEQQAKQVYSPSYIVFTKKVS